MPPIRLNRRRFLGCSAAASLAVSQGDLAQAAAVEAQSTPVRMAIIGLGNRGTALLRTMIELPGAPIVALCDPEARHARRAQGIAEKALGQAPDTYDDPRRVFDRHDIDAVVIALPCDLHERTYRDAIKAGKHLYAEKPLGITLAGCDSLIAEASRASELVVQVGFQRRSNARFREGVELIRQGELGPLIEARATWTSSNGPMNGHRGWLGRRDRSGDWMVEQGVHIWDVFQWFKGGLPIRASGWGRQALFTAVDPLRDVTDHYAVELEWPDGFRASFLQSWIAPADDAFTGSSLRVMGEDGGFDFATGALTYRDRSRSRRAIHPGAQPDTRNAVETFLQAVRIGSPTAPPISLAEARAATQVGLLVRRAVDLGRVVSMDEITAESSPPASA